MSPTAFADLLGARSAGRNKWQARCPAHPDRSPSLTIHEGAEDRVLLHCFAGCQTSAILTALGLTMRDLFNDAPMDPRARAKAREHRAEREAEERHRARVERRVGDLYRRAVRVADALGTRVAYAPDGPESDALAALAHRAFRLRDEIESRCGGPEPLGGAQLAEVCLRWSPFPEPDPEAVEAWRVTTEAQRLRFMGTGFAEPPMQKVKADQPCQWCWRPSRLPDEDAGDALYAAQLDTLAEFEALRGNPRAIHERTTKAPLRAGL